MSAKKERLTDGFVCVCGHTLVEHRKIMRGIRYVGRGACRKCNCKKFMPLNQHSNSLRTVQQSLVREKSCLI